MTTLDKLIDEVREAIAEGHEKELAIRASVFAYNLNAKKEKELRDAVAKVV